MTPDEMLDQARRFERTALRDLLTRNGKRSFMNRWYDGRAAGMRQTATMLRLQAGWETDQDEEDAWYRETLDRCVRFREVLPFAASIPSFMRASS